MMIGNHESDLGKKNGKSAASVTAGPARTRPPHYFILLLLQSPLSPRVWKQLPGIPFAVGSALPGTWYMNMYILVPAL